MDRSSQICSIFQKNARIRGMVKLASFANPAMAAKKITALLILYQTQQSLATTTTTTTTSIE